MLGISLLYLRAPYLWWFALVVAVTIGIGASFALDAPVWTHHGRRKLEEATSIRVAAVMTKCGYVWSAWSGWRKPEEAQ